MTDKQTIIDGVDVAGCKYFNRFRNICHNKNLCCDCEKNQDCYFKQLARKTKECEVLKKKLNTSEEWRIKAENLNEKQDLENTRYRKALEEIEKVCLKDVRIFADGTVLRYDSLDDILDIINKLKGGNDE